MTQTLAALARKIESALAERTGGPVAVRDLAALPGGACQDNYRVDVNLAAGSLAGDRRFVLRSDARRSLPGSIGRRDEFAVVTAAVGAGVRTPQARWLTPDLVRPGAFAYFLDWLDGESVGRRVVRNPELAAAREALPADLAEAVARIHRVTPRDAPDLRLSPLGVDRSGDPAAAFVQALVSMLDDLPEPRPVVELAAAWLADHAPRPPEVSLVHGDFRTGNFMVQPAGLAGLFDWEFAHWGDPVEDLAWISVRDWRFGHLDRPVGGFARREPFYAAYERASGRRLEPDRLRWWEIAGNARWAVGSLYQGERYLSGQECDVELVAIGRRAAEMEFEALRLIERGD